MIPKNSRQGAFLERQAESNTTISSLQAENDALRTESEALRTDNDFLREQVAIMAEHTKAHAALKRAVAKLRPEVEIHKQQIREADVEHTKSLSFFMSTFMETQAKEMAGAEARRLELQNQLILENQKLNQIMQLSETSKNAMMKQIFKNKLRQSLARCMDVWVDVFYRQKRGRALHNRSLIHITRSLIRLMAIAFVRWCDIIQERKVKEEEEIKKDQNKALEHLQDQVHAAQSEHMGALLSMQLLQSQQRQNYVHEEIERRKRELQARLSQPQSFLPEKMMGINGDTPSPTRSPMTRSRARKMLDVSFASAHANGQILFDEDDDRAPCTSLSAAQTQDKGHEDLELSCATDKKTTMDVFCDAETRLVRIFCPPQTKVVIKNPKQLFSKAEKPGHECSTQVLSSNEALGSAREGERSSRSPTPRSPLSKNGQVMWPSPPGFGTKAICTDEPQEIGFPRAGKTPQVGIDVEGSRSPTPRLFMAELARSLRN